MSVMEVRSCRAVLLLVLCLICWRCVEFSSATAQEQSRPNAPVSKPAESTSQRMLPLPEGASADLKQQLKWLQSLQGLMAVEDLGSDKSTASKFDPEQLNALLNAMKQLSGAVLPGTAFPTPDSQLPDSKLTESLFKKMSDPAVQEQMRQLLKQFSQDGRLPPGKESTDPKSLPFPLGSRSPTDGPAGKVPPMPPAAQELMKRLLQQAGRQPKEPTNDQTSGAPSRKPASLGRDRNEPDGSASSVLPPANSQSANRPKPSGKTPADSERIATGPRIPGALDVEPKTNLDRVRKELEAASRDRQDQSKPLPRGSKTTQKSSGSSKFGSEPEKGETENRDSQPSMNGAEATTERGRTRESSTKDPTTSAKTPIEPPTAPPSIPSVSPANVSPKPQQIDVRSELQQNGFAQTLRKLIDQSREESQAEANNSVGASNERQDADKGAISGLQKSLARFVDGFRKDLVREATQSPSSTPAPSSSAAASTQPPTPTPGPERRSTAGKLFESVGKALNEMAAAPDSQPRNVQPQVERIAGGSSQSQGSSSRSTGSLLLLLAALGLVWYFLPRVVTAVKESPLFRRSNSASEWTSSADIRTREDVVRAFHQFALRSTMPVSDWWTHREVERQVADSAPALKPSIKVLADLYELARYLPGEVELTPDQVSLARRELENVSKTNPPRT